jgi:hypothetical protein
MRCIEAFNETGYPIENYCVFEDGWNAAFRDEEHPKNETGLRKCLCGEPPELAETADATTYYHGDTGHYLEASAKTKEEAAERWNNLLSRQWSDKIPKICPECGVEKEPGHVCYYPFGENQDAMQL